MLEPLARRNLKIRLFASRMAHSLARRLSGVKSLGRSGDQPDMFVRGDHILVDILENSAILAISKEQRRWYTCCCSCGLG